MRFRGSEGHFSELVHTREVLVWTNSLKCPRTEEAFIGSREQPETQ